ncbi:MAG: hypothetical protein U1E81_17895 [Xanthobacteraceae bacterium]
MRRFRLLRASFVGDVLQPTNAVVTLPDGAIPGDHMVELFEDAPEPSSDQSAPAPEHGRN